jgi:hypothetical protein
MTPLLFAAEVSSNLFFKWLAIAGGALVGGILIGWLANFLTHLVTRHKLPTWGTNGARLGGAVLGAWLVALWAFGEGGSDPGGAGGGIVGGPGGKKETEEPKRKKDDEVKPEKKNGETPRAERLYIEVLGTEALKALKQPAGETQKIYRIKDEPNKTLYDLATLKTVLNERRREGRDLQVKAYLYQDSPDKENRPVKALTQWLVEEKLTSRDEAIAAPGEFSPEVRSSKE